MTASGERDDCPYRGLQPYTERDRKYFFGRERDREIIISNLFASSLTVFYGASGVGKSSVLLAGVVPELKTTPRLAVVVFRDWQDAAFEAGLRAEVLRAVGEAAGREVQVEPGLEFDEFLHACIKAFRGELFFVLDQFEEYFLYHPISPQTEGFDAAFARAVNRQEIGANFLLSMRDDGLSRLDRFRKRIPNLLNNMLRLEHLDRAAAVEAIRRPLEKYNELREEGSPRMRVEDELVGALLEDLGAGKVTLNLTGQGKVWPAARDGRPAFIETPFLQVVLTRLWEEEHAAEHPDPGSRALRLQTYERLGRATTIVRTHLDKVMETERLRPHRDTAAALFHYLVTPGGQKIAHTPADLSSYARLPRHEVEGVLNALSHPEVRVLRPVAPPPDQPGALRYEIFHDVLAPAILDWRARHMQKVTEEEAARKVEEERREARRVAEEKQRQLEQATALAAAERQRAEAEERLRLSQTRAARRFRWATLGLAVLFLLTLATSVYALYTRDEALRSKDEAEGARNVALLAKAEADQAKGEALKAGGEAVAAREAESKERQRAEQKADEAERERQRAEQQAAKAEQSARAALEAKNRESAERARAERERQRAEDRAAEAQRERDRAAEAESQALASAQEATRQKEVAEMVSQTDALYREAFWLSRNEAQKEEAVSKFQQALGVYRKLSYQRAVVDTLLNIGGVYLDLDKAEPAEKSFMEAVENSKDAAERAATFTLIGGVYNKARGKSGKAAAEKAAGYYQKAGELFKSLDDKQGQAGVLLNLSEMHMSDFAQAPDEQGAEHVNRAVAKLREAAALYRQMADHKGEALALFRAGEAMVKLWLPRPGEDPSTISYFKEARSAYRKAGDREGEANSLERLSQVSSTVGQRQDAITYLQELVELHRAGANPAGEARALESLADYFGPEPEEGQDGRKSVELLLRAVQLYRAGGERKEAASALDALGSVYRRMELYGEAARAWEESVNEYGQIGDRPEEIRLTTRLAQLALTVGDRQKAKSYVEKSVLLVSQLKSDLFMDDRLVDIGDVYLGLREPETAAGFFEQAANATREYWGEGSGAPVRFAGYTYRRIGTAYSKHNMPDKALLHFITAIGLFQKAGAKDEEVSTLMLIGEIHLNQKNYGRAVESFERAAQIYHTQEDVTGQAAALAGLVSAYRAMGDSKKADEYEERARSLLKPPQSDKR
ncbi:MAG TPA: tetratricopeptide repeat protein [Pyrinomonadaceae bacterium]|nr:tetratricopeptide repeat protein [Pyrinomonadaceae bacterium]